MKYIVFDLEWNQCPTGKEHEDPLLPFEILEIGACRLNERLETEDSFHSFVSPKVYKTLHYMTRRVIHLTKADLKNQPSFPEACARFFEWCGSDCVFCSWGPSDLYELQRNMAWHHIPPPFSFPLLYCDIQKIFSRTYQDGKSRLSLAGAVEMLNIPALEDFHGALSDAHYTAAVASRLNPADLQTWYSVDYYRLPSRREEEIRLQYPTYNKYVTRPFPNKNRALRDRDVCTVACPVCGAVCQKKIRWMSIGSRNCIALYVCREHGYVRSKARLRAAAGDQVYIIRTDRLCSTEEAEKIISRTRKS